jgi:hypothetical protein
MRANLLIIAPLLILAAAAAAQGRLGLASYILVCLTIVGPVFAGWAGELDDQ